MLVDGKSVLDAAKAGRYGIVAPDFLTLNAARVFVQTADDSALFCTGACGPDFP